MIRFIIFTIILIVSGCASLKPQPVEVKATVVEVNPEVEIPARVNFKLIKTTPPNPLVPPPIYSDYVSDSITTYYPDPKQAYLNDMVKYNQYVRTYIADLSTTYNIDSEDYKQLVACSEGREFPTLDIDPIPTSPDLSSYDKPEDAYGAFVKYAQGLYDYATKVSSAFNDSIVKFNSECQPKG